MTKGVTSRSRRPLPEFGPANVWFCEHCGEHGSATFDDHATVKGAVDMIRAAHTLQAPKCDGGTTFIRLVNIDKLKARGLVA